MALFQEAIVKNYISKLDPEKVDKAFSEFKSIYSEANIKIYKKIKEEAHQGEFIEDIFGKVLGYQRHSDIKREYKNENDAKKADAAILKEDNVVGVIELKDNKTKNLSDVQAQAFNYKVNHKNCSYVITSNFHKLRFYIDDTTDYEEFDLYNLDKESFRRFYLYLQREGLLEKNLPKLLRQETKFHEEEISKNLYKDYSNFKRSFFENALKNNPQFDKLSLFKKSQKFLDRVLFVLFAEDKGLVTTNSVVQIVEKWQALRDDAFDTPRPLYTLVLLFFNNLYLGKKDNKGTVLIPEFGGELFAPDEVLDQLTIDDDVLKDDLLKLSKYDFNTDVDVNILGHIFEHSLNEVDDVEAELRGEQLDKTKSKRKKDGVFYTPKYITKYIVDNTLGKLCSEMKTELKLDVDILIDDYQKTDGKLNEKGKDLFERLNTYKSWLLTVKVCDPACGSGAFLNQALSFFIEEHKFVDDLIAELTNSPLRLFDTDLQILENNIYGVDINEESVEIAKLSMWLRTAQPGRKLSNLSNNIKCGNSLIDDIEVAGKKAFNWEREFPSVFEDGGFDVVIGNPPYGAKLDETTKNSLRSIYPEVQFKIDTYSCFTLLLFRLLKSNGLGYYIIPNTLLDNYFEENVRRKVLDEAIVVEIIDLDDKIFEDAVVHSMIFGIKKSIDNDYLVKIGASKTIFEAGEYIPASYFKEQDKYTFSIRNYRNKDLLNKINIESIPLKDVLDIRQTIKTGDDSKYISKDCINDSYKPILSGRDIQKWVSIDPSLFVNYGKHLACPRDPKIFEQPKILIREAGNQITATLDEDNYYIMSSLYSCLLINNNFTLKFLLCLINSRLFQFQLKLIAFDKTEGAFTKARIFHYYQLPIKEVSIKIQNEFDVKADIMLDKTKSYESLKLKFGSLLSSDFSIIPLPKKLSQLESTSWTDFEKELQKNKITLLGVQKDDWFDRFERFKKQALELKSQIDQTDKEIDRMVYECYGLTEEEIQIVENT